MRTCVGFLKTPHPLDQRSCSDATSEIPDVCLSTSVCDRLQREQSSFLFLSSCSSSGKLVSVFGFLKRTPDGGPGPMKFAIFGLSISSSWGNGHATIWRGLCRALSRLGHRVTFFEKDVPYYAAHRDLTASDDYDLVLYSDWKEIGDCVERATRESDASIVTSYCQDSQQACDAVLNSRAQRKVFYDLDTPVTLESFSRRGWVDYIPSYGLAPFDLVLSYTGGNALQDLQQRMGARNVAPLYGCADPAIHKPVNDHSSYASDLSYLGTYAPDRQGILQQLFLEPARRSPEKKFLIGGAQYPEDFPWSENVWFVHHVPPGHHPAFYSSCSLTLSVTRAPMASCGFCPSARLFEAAACRTPVISDYWPGLESFFEPGREILVAENPNDVVEALSRDSRDLREIGAAAHERVLAEHTASHRAEQLLELLEAA